MERTVWMYKMEGTRMPESEMLAYTKTLGIEKLNDEYNNHTLPEPFVEQDGKEFNRFSTLYSPRYMNLVKVKLETGRMSQYHNRPVELWCNAWLWYFHDCAWAVVSPPYSGGSYEAHPEEMKVRYFQLGCVHEFSSKNVGRCLHQLTCKLCGSTHTIDSSD